MGDQLRDVGRDRYIATAAAIIPRTAAAATVRSQCRGWATAATRAASTHTTTTIQAASTTLFIIGRVSDRSDDAAPLPSCW